MYGDVDFDKEYFIESPDSDEISAEDLDLTPDMSRVWGAVLRGLRESGENLLHAALTDLNTADYTRDTIEILCRDESLYNLLMKHKAKLEKFTGAGCININRPAAARNNNNVIITGLRNLFGDKLTVLKK